MEIVIKKVFQHPMINNGKKEITPIKINGETLKECFVKVYEYERGSRYNNYQYYDFEDLEIKKEYYEWKKTGVTISMYYGGGVVD